MALLSGAGLYLVLSMYSGEQGQSAAGKVRLNEVMTSNPGVVPDENGDYPDWVEFYNPLNEEIDISGFGLTDDKLTAAKWVFPSGTRISPKGYLVVFFSKSENSGPLHAPFKLSAKDDLVLMSPTGRAIDSLALTSVAAGSTLSRDELTGAWTETAFPSPGFPNTEEGSLAFFETLKENVVDNGVRLNEFMASNATTLPGPDGSYPDWVELYNTTGEDVDLSGCGLSDNIKRPMKWSFPEGTIIKAHDVLIIFCSGRDGLIDGSLHAPFALRTYKEDVVFSSRKGKILDSISYAKQETDRSMARIPDGTGEWQQVAQPTPGFLNTDEGFSEFSRTALSPKGPIQLSEALSCNASSLERDSQTPDWIELYNSSSESVDLNGWALSDNPKNPEKWVFPDTAIAPGEYLLVFATGADIKDTQKKKFETNFALSSKGEVVLLFSPEGELMDKLQLPFSGADISYGRTSAGLRYFKSPTPGEKNSEGYLGITALPEFSTKPGVYEHGIEVALSVDEGSKIFYTTDCTVPTPASMLYAEPIKLEKNTVIRAVAVREGYLPGSAATGTYLFNNDGAKHTLPIAALVTDPKHLWDKKSGIYAFGEKYDPDLPYAEALLNANFYQGRGTQGEEMQTAWERPFNFAIYGEDNLLAFSQDVSARIGGAFGRGRSQKAFNIIARSQYGSNRMEYPFFENRQFTEYKSLVLRAGAQDQNRSKIRDELSTGLLEGTDVRFLFQAYKPYVLYLNGEYWGVYFLKEKRSRFFVAAHEGVSDSDSLDLLKASTQISHGSNKEWLSLMDYIRNHDLSQEANYKYVDERLDADSFMDYMICELYTGNTDYANIQYYKLPGGKWKWVFYDFCWGFNNIEHTTIKNRRGTVPAASDLFNAMLSNPGWRDRFIRRFGELMDTVYAPERVNKLIDALYADVEPEIKREREKFNGPTFMGVKQHQEVYGSYESFLRSIEYIRKFANERPKQIKAQLKSEFNLSDEYMREVFG